MSQQTQQAKAKMMGDAATAAAAATEDGWDGLRLDLPPFKLEMQSGRLPHQRKTRRYGWRRDLPDYRDVGLAFSLARGFPAGLPDEVDDRGQYPEVYDQGALGSCTANALAALFARRLFVQGLRIFRPSRLFIYYEERRIEQTIEQDSGATLRDGIKVVAKIGAPPETDWPYDIGLFAQQPPGVAYTDAKLDLAVRYARVPRDRGQMMAAMAAGHHFAFGFSVFTSFESEEVARTGVVPMPKPGEDLEGGHAVVTAGYRKADDTLLCRNSWGPDWGEAGHFRLPFGYILDKGLAADFWTIDMVTEGGAPAA